MGRVIELRVARLEAGAPKGPPDLTRLTDEELHEALFDSLRATIADPASTPAQVARAERMLNLRWDLPISRWEMDDLRFFHNEAHRRD